MQGFRFTIGCAVAYLALATSLLAAESFQKLIEADWLKQAERWDANPVDDLATGVATRQDAAGGVDGVKDGTFGFHTARQPNPWWQVHLGQSTIIGRIVVFNRLDYPPGLHNADNLVTWFPTTPRNGNRSTTARGGISAGCAAQAAGGHLQARRGQGPLRPPANPHCQADLPPPGRSRGLRGSRSSQEHCLGQAGRPEQCQPMVGGKGWPADGESDGDPAGRHRRLYPPRAGTGGASSQCGRGHQALRARQPDAVSEALEKLPKDAPPENRRRLYLQTRWAWRHAAFADPLLNFDRILLAKRYTQETYPDVCLNHMPWVSRPGGDLCVVSAWKSEGEVQVRTLLNGAIGPGHVHGIDLWWDALAHRVRLCQGQERSAGAGFSRTAGARHPACRRADAPLRDRHRRPGPAATDRPPTLERSRSHLLPSGEIAFVSERCGCSLQCNEMDKDETSCNLYVMRAGRQRHPPL